MNGKGILSIHLFISKYHQLCTYRNIHMLHIRSLSIICCVVVIMDLSWDPSFTVTEHAMTGLVTPQARPSACFDRTNTYGTFWKTTYTTVTFGMNVGLRKSYPYYIAYKNLNFCHIILMILIGNIHTYMLIIFTRILYFCELSSFPSLLPLWAIHNTWSSREHIYVTIPRLSPHQRTLSSQRSGRCIRISRGSASAAITINSDIPRFSVFVAESLKNF